jgi:hypothetical protein
MREDLLLLNRLFPLLSSREESEEEVRYTTEDSSELPETTESTSAMSRSTTLTPSEKKINRLLNANSYANINECM